MSFKILIPILGIAALMFSSCAPMTPYYTEPSSANRPTLTADQQAAKLAEEKRLEEEARSEARRQAEVRGDDQGDSSAEGPFDTTTPDPDSTKPDYRRAIPIPGKKGFVFNPFTNNPVDVRGIPSGTLVRDPQDPNMAHKFRVP